MQPAGRKWLFRLVLAAAPLLLLGLCETGLRLFGCGYPTEFLVPTDDGGALSTNEEFGRRFFPREIARAPHPLRLPADKAPGTYRIFILGESAAMGTPDASLGFGRMLEAMLRLRFPATRFEVVNAAMTAISSHTVLPIARDCAAHSPDLFVVYMGNNEYVGPYGPATVFGGFSSSLTGIRAGLWFKSTRVGQLLEALFSSPPGGADGPRQWRGMEMFLKARVPADDPRRAKVASHFRANLEDILAAVRGAGARAVVCTVAVNRRDNPPFASLHRTGLGEADKARWDALYQQGIDSEAGGDPAKAAGAYRKAMEIDDQFAELHYRLAGCLLRGGGPPEEVRRHFAAAVDCDALPFRADGPVNAAIREVAVAQGDVRLADAERAFESDPRSVGGVPGEELLYEHVHPNPAGNRLLAETVFRQVAGVLPEPIRRTAAGDADMPPPRAECDAALALTEWDEHRMAAEMADQTGKPPFVGQVGHTERQTRRLRALADFRRDRAAVARDAAVPIYRAAIAAAPGDWHLRDNFAALQHERGDQASAAENWRSVLAEFPRGAAVRVRLGTALLRGGRIGEAEAEFRAALEVRPKLAPAHKGLGDALLLQGKPREAVAPLTEALRLDPGYPEARRNLGGALAALHDFDGAEREFREALRLRPDAAGHFELASLLGKRGRASEALEQYRKAVELDPRHLPARTALAAGLAAEGKADEALAVMTETVRLHPGHGPTHAALGEALDGRGHAAEAAAQYRKVVEAKAAPPLMLTRLAWILATHPDPQVRDGAEAVRLAEQACNLAPAGGGSAMARDVLGAALAEAGRFPEALAAANEAARLAGSSGNPGLQEAIRRRAEGYAAGRPFRTP